MRASPAGSPLNTDIALSRLGELVCCLGALSAHRFGRQIHATLGSAGDHTRRSSYRAPTAHARDLEAAVACAAGFAALQCTRASAWRPAPNDDDRLPGESLSRADVSREENEWPPSSSMA